MAACSSSTIAIGQAVDAIRRGRLDAALAGGTDALSRLTFAGFNALRLMDPQPCRPFDAGRQGMNIGEGAAILVLEDWERASRRGAHIYAELAGYSFTCEAYHPTAPEPEGQAIASTIRAALDDARGERRGCDARERARHGDAAERQGRGARCARRLRRPRDVLPVTSLKAMFGHCLGAAGAMEAAALAMTIDRGCHPADHPPRHDRSGVPGRSRGEHSTRGAGPVRRVDVPGIRRQRFGAGAAPGVGCRSSASDLKVAAYGLRSVW